MQEASEHVTPFEPILYYWDGRDVAGLVAEPRLRRQ